jgi:hypothetical protein
MYTSVEAWNYQAFRNTNGLIVLANHHDEVRFVYA